MRYQGYRASALHSLQHFLMSHVPSIGFHSLDIISCQELPEKFIEILCGFLEKAAGTGKL